MKFPFMKRRKAKSGKPQETPITLTFLYCPDRFTSQRFERTFGLSNTISSIESAMKEELGLSQSEEINLLWQGEVLDPETSLQSTFKQGGYIHQVTVIEKAAQLETSLYEMLKANKSEDVVDRIAQLLPTDPDREILALVYGRAVETTKVEKGQARFLVEKIVEYGFDLPCPIETQKKSLYCSYSNPTNPSREFLWVRPPVTPSAPLRPSPRSMKEEMKEVFDCVSMKVSEVGNEEESTECPICLETFHVSQTIAINCSSRHSACMDCAHSYVKASSTARIKCFGARCQHELLQQEIALIIGHGDVISGQRDAAFQAIDERQRDAVLAEDPQSYATCPCHGCNWTVARHARGESEEATCQQCNFVFCTNCCDRYHYRTTCAESIQVKSQWEDWIVVGRAAYWTNDKRKSSKAIKASKAERKRIKELRTIESRDEAYKAEHCRYCPHCNRIVEKIEGCDIMRCGYDTDNGRNRQNGCGKKFSWSKAQAYKPVKAGRNISYSAAAPESQKYHHVGVQCDLCKEDVRGLRFECINCKTFTLCEKCEANHNETHTAGHVFRIHKNQQK